MELIEVSETKQTAKVWTFITLQAVICILASSISELLFASLKKKKKKKGNVSALSAVSM